MPQPSNPRAVSRLRTTEINPVHVAVVLVVLAVAGGYFFWLRPAQQAEQDKRAFLSPEAAKMRGPGAPSPPGHEQFIQQLRAREQHSGAPTQR